MRITTKISIRLLVICLLASVLVASARRQNAGFFGSNAAPAAANKISVKSCVGGGVYSGTTATVNISPTNGDTVVSGIYAVSANAPASNFTSFQDNNSNNLTQDNSGWINVASHNADLTWFHISNVSSLTDVKITFGANQIIAMVVCDLSGVVNTSPVDVADNTGATWSGITASSGAITTLNNNDIVLGLFGDTTGGKTYSTKSPWTVGYSEDQSGSIDAAISYQIVSTATGYTPEATVTSISGNGLSMSYKSQ